MAGPKIHLARLHGISIDVDRSFFVLQIVLTIFFAQYFAGGGLGGLTTGIVTSVGLVLSMLLHELGHALAARRCRLPVRSITFFGFGGFTDLGKQPASASQELIIALAGPAVSAVFGTALLALSASSALGRINLLLALFNMLPIFPLDGGRALRAVLWKFSGDCDSATIQTRSLGLVIAYVVIMIGVVLLISLTIPGLVVLLIGWRLKELLGDSAAVPSHHAA